MEVEKYTPIGQGTYNTVAGSAGLASFLFGNGLSGLFGGGGANYVNKETFDVQLKLIDEQKANAILAADLASEKKMVEVFNAANDKINAVRDELTNYIRTVDTKVDSNAAAQAVINCGFNSSIGILQNQVAVLNSLTKTVIPNANICPGWGTATVAVSTGTTTA